MDSAKWRAANRERHLANEKKWRARNRDRRQAYELDRAFGKGASTHYVAKMVEQGGLCAICRRRPAKRLHLDHSHKTGRLRGLLCAKCNSGLGMFADSPIALRAAASYLEAMS